MDSHDQIAWRATPLGVCLIMPWRGARILRVLAIPVLAWGVTLALVVVGNRWLALPVLVATGYLTLSAVQTLLREHTIVIFDMSDLAGVNSADLIARLTMLGDPMAACLLDADTDTRRSALAALQHDLGAEWLARHHHTTC